MAGDGDASAEMIPDPEVVAKKTRRKLTAQYKLEIRVAESKIHP